MLDTIKKIIMKIEKINFTVLCLSIITIVDLIATGGGLSLFLWIGYGIFYLCKE